MVAAVHRSGSGVWFTIWLASSLAAQTSAGGKPAVRADVPEADRLGLPASLTQGLSSANSIPANAGLTTGRTGAQNADTEPEWIVAPFPIASEAIGWGGVLVVGYIFRPNRRDHESPQSVIGGTGAYTSTKTYGGGVGASLIFKQDRYRVKLVSGGGRARYEFFGIGNSAGEAGQSVWIKQHGGMFFAEGLRRIRWRIFAGVRYNVRRLSPAEDTGDSGSAAEMPGPIAGQIIEDLNQTRTTAAFGLRVQRDTRDSLFYPRKGQRLDLRGDFFGAYAGSGYSFSAYQAEVNKYLPVRERHVAAVRGMACYVTGSRIPFYELCQFGAFGDLRGYQAGRYRDRTMFAAQAEWRSALFWRLGGVAFGGVGEVAREWGQYTRQDLLPGGGLGLRFNLSRQQRINLRFDAAYSKTGFSWSMGVGEVF